jgi:hypothetical protein
MALPEPKDHRISLTDAAALTRRYRDHAGKTAGAEVPKCGLFLRRLIDELLAQPGCSGMRVYYGRTATGEDTFVLVGVDQKGDDMTGGTLLEDPFYCPPFCSTASMLNS